MSTTLQAELRCWTGDAKAADALEVVAACVRLRESALVYLQCDEGVWPVTLFPEQMVYHSPRDLVRGTRARDGQPRRPSKSSRPAFGRRGTGCMNASRTVETYHPLTPALWTLALQGPRIDLLHEIAGSTAYRALRNPTGQGLATPGALGPAIERCARSRCRCERSPSGPA